MNVHKFNSASDAPKIIANFEIPDLSLRLNNVQYRELVSLHQYFTMWEYAWKVCYHVSSYRFIYLLTFSTANLGL
jgi:hypothetical protein